MSESYYERARSAIYERLWAADISSLSPARAGAVRFVRAMHMVSRELSEGQLTLRAMSLVYTTLLSLVPLLAVSFSVLKAFGYHNQVEPLLLNFLAPLGERGVELTQQIVGFVENIKVGVLGAIGLALLFYTVIALIHKIERAFNYTWRVAQTRSLMERFSHYFSVLMIGPVLVLAALGITASLMSTAVVQQLVAIEPFGTAVRFGTRLVPYLLVLAAFTFVYVFIPNTKVQPSAAFTGAVVAAILWQTTGWAFASFVVTSTKYVAIYSSFAILFFFMLWVYLAWLILLVGASVAFYFQHPEYQGLRAREIELSSRMKDQIALLTAFFVGEHYYHGRGSWTADALSRRLGVPLHSLQAILGALEGRKILVRTRGEPSGYIPGRDLETIRVRDVLEAVRTAGEETQLSTRRLPSAPAVDAVLLSMEQAVGSALHERSIKDMVVAGGSDSPAIPEAKDTQPTAVPITGVSTEERGAG